MLHRVCCTGFDDCSRAGCPGCWKTSACRAGSQWRDCGRKLSTRSGAVEAVDREPGVADGRHWRVSRSAVAAVKVYDLVAGAAVDAAWREDPLVNRRVARPKLHCRATRGRRKQNEAGRDGFLLPPCSRQGLGELWWSGIPWRMTGIARVRRAKPGMVIDADKAIPTRNAVQECVREGELGICARTGSP